jgi:hypothetical protein
MIRKDIRIAVATSAAVGMLVGAGLTVALAQSPSRALDPPRVAPHIFEVVLDNERVRVLKVTERHGETQPLHSRADRVVVHMSPCGWVFEDEDGKTQMESYKVGDVYWRDAVTLGGQTSAVIQDCLSLAIELKDPGSAH